MKDLEKLEKVFTEIGVRFEKKTSIKECGTETHTLSYDGEATYDTKITLENGIGYYSFECDFYFLKGKFVNHGVWE
jgi:hypothetical protein